MATKKQATNNKPKLHKAGTRVKFTSKSGIEVKGRVHGYEDRANGQWVYVVSGDKEKGEPPRTHQCRPSQLTAY
jgi:hypothetical protein